MNILICDDSGMARKQMVRALPAQMMENVRFAENGQLAIEALEKEAFDILLLDLTMPIMDGYQTLEAMRERQIECLTFVVSADIQPLAQKRTKELGAAAFLTKPVDPTLLAETFQQFGLLASASLEAEDESRKTSLESAATDNEELTPEACLREVANIAMGQAADKLACLLGTFITIPIPKVAVLTQGELAMTLSSLASGQHIAVCQGFVGKGMGAEALLSTDLNGRNGLQKLMREMDNYFGKENIGAVLDAAAILTGAFLTGIGQTLDLEFSKGPPVYIWEHHFRANDWQTRLQNTSDTLSIEIPYQFSDQGFVCDLLLLFPDKAGDFILDRATYLIDGES